MTLKMESNSSSYDHHLMDDLPNSDVDQKTSLGFMELLGFQDYYNNYDEEINTATYHRLQQPPPLSSVETHHLNGDDRNQREEEELITAVDEDSSSVVLNGQQPSSPSITSSTAHQQLHINPPLKQCVKEKKAMGGDETKAKKKRKEKAPRFAFMTRTEIDNLDDGYRWRKYGQKAVKNSRFPRSYYRCTSTSCGVKKRVERCMGDPSYIVTTYEGQHNHSLLLSPAASSYNYSSAPSSFYNNHHPIITTAATTATATVVPPAMLKLDDQGAGLLQDMVQYNSCHHDY